MAVIFFIVGITIALQSTNIKASDRKMDVEETVKQQDDFAEEEKEGDLPNLQAILDNEANQKAFEEYMKTAEPGSHPSFPGLKEKRLPTQRIGNVASWGSSSNGFYKYKQRRVDIPANIVLGMNPSLKPPNSGYFSGGPYIYVGKDSSGRYLPEYLAYCIDIFHFIWGMDTNVGITDLRNFVTQEGADAIMDTENVGISLAYMDGMEFAKQPTFNAPITYNKETQEEYMFATQMILWSIASKERKDEQFRLPIETSHMIALSSPIGQPLREYDNTKFIDRVKNATNAYKDTSFFPTSTISLKKGESYTLNIPSDVNDEYNNFRYDQQRFKYEIDYYKSKNLDKVDVQVNSYGYKTSSITVTAKEDFNRAEVKVALNKTLHSPVERKEGYTGLYQDQNQFKVLFTMSPSVLRPVEINFDMEEDPRGSVKLRKINSENQNETLAGAEFSLYKDNVVIRTGLTTGSDGTLVVGDLELGSYYFVETKAPKGFVLDTTPRSFTLTMENTTASLVIEIPNKKIDRKFNFKKLSEGTTTGLSGVEFKLQKYANGVWIRVSEKIYSTDNNGEIKFSEADINLLGEGTYRLEEVTPHKDHIMPTGDAKFSASFTISRESVTPSSIQMSNKKINRNFEFIKTSSTKLPTGGAEFLLQKKLNNVWVNVSPESKHVTDSAGKFRLDEAKLKALSNAHGKGPYRFKEIKAPEDHDLPIEAESYSKEFMIERESVVPDRITMENKVTNHELILEKKGKESDGSQVSLPGAKFVLQGKQSNGSWKRFNNTEFITNANGKIVINNGTHSGLIKQMIQATTYSEFRFREIEVPKAWYRDPKYDPDPNGVEAAGKPGDDFSVLIGIKEFREGVRTIKRSYTLVNELLIYEAGIQKANSAGNNITGAEFSLWNIKMPNNKKVAQGNAEGFSSWSELVIGETYVIKETKAPDGYGLQSYHYFITLSKEATPKMKIERSETETGTRELLTEGKDYTWDKGKLKLSFKVKNNKVREVPMTGGRYPGLYVTVGVGSLLLGLAYTVQVKTKRRRGV